MTFRSAFSSLKNSVWSELKASYNNMRQTRLNLAFLFAVFCVFLVIVGNVILLISINFWLSIFPQSNIEHNSSQIAIQVVTMIFILVMFSILTTVFIIVYGARPIWEVLVDHKRMRGPLYRFFLLFMSGASNGLSSVLGVYAMTYTPEFVQAILLCCIPFSAQAWTVIFIPIERQRNYLSFFFITSFLFFVAGVLLGSLSAFITPNEEGEHAPWAWALIYLASSVLFGLWCVVQRLYLDAAALQDTVVAAMVAETNAAKKSSPSVRGEKEQNANAPGAQGIESLRNENNLHYEGGEREPAPREGSEEGVSVALAAPKADPTAPYQTEDDRLGDCEDDEEDGEEEEFALDPSVALLKSRQWASLDVDGNAAKLTLLMVGLLFQLLVSFVCFPADAIPWFGTSDSAAQAWDGFVSSMIFIFGSWMNVRYGLLYALGYAMSFIGCTYLNEHSPTLASVVLQLAGPITSLVIIIIPQWNVYQDPSSVGQKVGSVILLLIAAVLYHLWEQESSRLLEMKAMARAMRERERAADGRDGDEEELHEDRDDPVRPSQQITVKSSDAKDEYVELDDPQDTKKGTPQGETFRSGDEPIDVTDAAAARDTSLNRVD